MDVLDLTRLQFAVVTIYHYLFVPLSICLAATAAGHRAADGLEMLIAQGAEAFERWFGRPADRDVMRHALRA